MHAVLSAGPALAVQDLNEMELLMGRAEQERRALEAELASMRGTAGDATRQLLLADEELAVRMLAALAAFISTPAQRLSCACAARLCLLLYLCSCRPLGQSARADSLLCTIDRVFSTPAADCFRCLLPRSGTCRAAASRGARRPAGSRARSAQRCSRSMPAAGAQAEPWGLRGRP